MTLPALSPVARPPSAPTGDYDNTKLFNISSNRWTFIPELGLGWSFDKWSIEAALAQWIFMDNSVLGGNLGAGAELSGFGLSYQVLW